MRTDPVRCQLRRGSLILTEDCYRNLLLGTEGVVLLRKERDFLLLPVRHAAAGGYVIKMLNASGDRIVSAQDFFRAQGIDDDAVLEITMDWSDEHHALIAEGLFN